MSVAKYRSSTLGIEASFGFGDRIGLATAGHVQAMKRAGSGIMPIFPQQSIREMARTCRKPEDVMEDALRDILLAGWTGPTGADADHLKTSKDVKVTADAGFTFFTIDPSDHVDQQTDNYDEHTLRERFSDVQGQISWWDTYFGRETTLATGTKVVFTEEVCMRCAVKYGLAIQKTIELAEHIRQVQDAADRDYEIELSVDETNQPTTLAEHYIVANQCLANHVKLVSLAPRFIGDFEKGIDYIGDVSAFEKSLNDHVAIAEKLGPYKLSLHSGSDKLSIYPALARATRGRFHVKTAGTSYLEALRVIALCNPEMFRRICEFSRERYNADKKTYHVHASLETTPPPSELTHDTKLQDIYLQRWETVPDGRGFTESGRQILHCTFGSVLTDEELGPAVRRCLEDNKSTYDEVLCEHFCRHLEALQEGMA